MFYAILNAFRRIIRDFRTRRNLLEYGAVIAALFMIVLDIFTDVIPISTQLSLIIFILGLLVFQTTLPKQESADLDAILKNRQAFGRYADYVAGRKTVWILITTGINLNFADLKQQILDNGGSVRILLLDPEAPDSLAYLSQQLEADANLEGDLIAVIGRLRKLNWPNFEYRFLTINPGFSMQILDAQRPNGLLTVEFYGYRSDLINNRMHIDIPRQGSQYWFEYWVNQYEVMWQNGRPDD